MAEHHIQLVVTEAASRQIANEGYDPLYGARPLKRVIQRRLQNALATELLKQNVDEGATIRVDYVDDEFTFDISPSEAEKMTTAS